MAVWNVIRRSSLRESIRFDAEYQRPDDVQFETKLLQNGASFLKSHIIDFRSGKNLPQLPMLIDGVSVPFLRTQNVRRFLVDNMGMSFTRATPSATIQKGDLLAVRVGAGVGDISVVGIRHDKTCISDNVLRIRVQGVNPFYLSAFLLSKYGQQFLNKTQKGTARGLVSRENFHFIPVLIVSDFVQNWFEETILLAEELVKESESLYAEAQSFLESELCLDKLSFQKPVGYMTQVSALEQARRFDPEHFYPAFHNFVTNLPKHIKLVPLATQLSFCQRGIQPVYSDHGLPVINSKHVQTNKVLLEDNRTALVGSIADFQIRFGDILMNGTGRGTLGRVAPFLKSGQAIPDNHVTILRSQSLDPAFLSFYLNSQAGQLQVESHQRGTSGQIELYPFDIKKFLVWSAPESLQKEIRNLYDQAAEAEQRSKELLEQAKTRVEQLIEEAVKS